MNRFKFILRALMVLSVFGLWNCSKEDPEKEGPQLTVTPESLQFEAEGELVSQEINISTNRDWSAAFVEPNASEWAALDVSQGSGDAVVKVSVLPNKGTERTATIKITASVLSANVKITQLANGTIAKADTLYFENCGTTVAKDGNYWPYVDQFTGWSRKGTLDQSAVTYSGNSSNVSNSGSAFDPAEGSNLSKPPYVGMNKNTSKFIINNINIKGNDNLTLKFGGIFQSAYSGGATFGEIKSGDFKLYAGFDGSKYAELGYTTESAGGNWYWIKSEFKVPAGAEKLYVKIETSNIGSNQGYRFDDFTIINVGEGNLINPDGGVTPPTPGEKTYISVAQLRAKGETTVTEDVYAKVTVVSDKDGGNSTSLKNIVVSDATAGITIRFAANSDLAIGTELELNLKGAQLSKYNGLLQLNNFVNDKAVATGVVKKLDPVSISAADLMSGKYESMYVSVADVQVVESELNGTVGDASNHKSVNMEAKTGEKFIMFTSKYSKFVEDKLPQGSGALKGIASINTNKEGETSIQMLPTVASDYAALTGARFSSGTATLSFGTPVFKANLFKEKVAIEGGKLTIPYSNADGTEKYTVSVAVSGAAANGINAVSNKEVALAKGSGNIEIAITGTPANAGAVTFEINGIEALSVKTVKANVASATAANYDSNVTVPEDKTNSVYTSYEGADILVKIDGNSYKCVKFGTAKKTGVGTTTVLPKTGDAKLTFYAYGWKGKKGALKITVNNGGTINGSSSVTTDAINGNDGCTGNGPFELSSVDTSALLSYELKDMTDKTTITIESTKENGATDPRVVIFAINVK